MKLSGTSMATAVTSGVIALMLEAHAATQQDDAPPLTPNTVKGVLQYSAIATNWGSSTTRCGRVRGG